MIGLIDFDGTVVYHVPEGVCPEDTGAERVLKRLVENGHKIVLWTCRNESEDNPFNFVDGKPKNPNSLQEAINWYRERNIPLHAINDVPESKKYIGTSRKPICDFVIDDLNIGTPIREDYVTCNYYSGRSAKIKAHCVDWKLMEKLLEQRGIL